MTTLVGNVLALAAVLFVLGLIGVLVVIAAVVLLVVSARRTRALSPLDLRRAGGLGVLLATGVLTLADIAREGDVLATFIWFAALFTLSDQLNQLGFMEFLGGRLVMRLGGLPAPVVGVVLVVAPWNYPFLCSVNAVVPALLAGPVRVRGVWPARDGSTDLELATAAGIPDGGLPVVPGLGETAGQALGPPPHVHMIAVTRSPGGGELFLRSPGGANMDTVAPQCAGTAPPHAPGAARAILAGEA